MRMNPRDQSTPSERSPGPVFYKNLESLRGLAALSVVVVHCVGCFQSSAHATGFGARILALFFDAFNGRNAVVLFFVLSGFVLCESIRQEATSFRLLYGFLIRRAFRIVPVAYVALIFAVLYLFLCPSPDSEVLSESAQWFRRGFERPTPILVLADFAFLSNQSIVVYWTLYVEFAASLLFVPLVWMSRLGGWTVQICLQTILLLASYRYAGETGWLHLLWLPVRPAFFIYFFCFHLGIMFNRLRHRIPGGSSHTGNPGGTRSEIINGITAMLGAYVLCYAHSTIGASLSKLLPLGYKPEALQIALEALGSCLLVYGCSGVRNRLVDWILGSAPIRYLGKLSFGIYAIHIVVLKPVFVFVASRFGSSLIDHPLLGPILAVTIVVPLSIVLAHLMHRLIEMPGIRLGRRLVAPAQLRGAPRASTSEAMEDSGVVP
jgi:peptidoglycan/LPS O-acetylase OafA/YrhL